MAKRRGYYQVQINGEPVFLDVDMGTLSQMRHITSNRRHCNAEYEITIVLDGTLCGDFGSERHTLRKGRIVVIPQGVYHCLHSCSRDLDHFSFRFLPGSGSLNDMLAPSLSTLHLFDTTPEIVRLCISIYELYARRTAFWQELMYTQMKELLLHVLRMLYQEPYPEAEYDYGQLMPRKVRIDRYIDQHLVQPPDLDELARLLHVSRRQLTREIQEHFGMSFRKRLLIARMDRAAWLLCTTDRSIDEIAGEVGYVSGASFYQAFRGYFGMTPLQYRKAHALSRHSEQ